MICFGYSVENAAEIPRQNCGKIPWETRGFAMPKDRYITVPAQILQGKIEVAVQQGNNNSERILIRILYASSH